MNLLVIGTKAVHVINLSTPNHTGCNTRLIAPVHVPAEAFPVTCADCQRKGSGARRGR